MDPYKTRIENLKIQDHSIELTVSEYGIKFRTFNEQVGEKSGRRKNHSLLIKMSA